jgi:hypothetical protein
MAASISRRRFVQRTVTGGGTGRLRRLWFLVAAQTAVGGGSQTARRCRRVSLRHRTSGANPGNDLPRQFTGRDWRVNPSRLILS